MQHSFEAALSLLESQKAVSSDAMLLPQKIYQKPAFQQKSESSCTSDSSDFDELPRVECPEHQAQINEKKFKPSSSKRQQLTDAEAVEIFKLRPKPKMGKGLRRGSMLLCKTLAPKYGVSPKTIRDIWRGRTWLHATESLWTDEEKLQKSWKSTSTSRNSSEPNHCGDLCKRMQATECALRSTLGQRSSISGAIVSSGLQREQGSLLSPILQQNSGWMNVGAGSAPTSLPYNAFAASKTSAQGCNNFIAAPPALSWTACGSAPPPPAAVDPALLRLLCAAGLLGAPAKRAVEPPAAAFLPAWAGPEAAGAGLLHPACWLAAPAVQGGAPLSGGALPYQLMQRFY